MQLGQSAYRCALTTNQPEVEAVRYSAAFDAVPRRREAKDFARAGDVPAVSADIAKRRRSMDGGSFPGRSPETSVPPDPSD